jgi:Rieske Fe-S protein
MSEQTELSRRSLLMKLGIMVNGVVAALVSIPIVGYLFSPLRRNNGVGSEAWISLGPVTQFPVGQTRIAAYRNPLVSPWDGQTADIPCWVRRIADEQFQVFAVNCAHLGCPVRWFSQSGLFMCPCHGGVYYADGSRASGPPPRGLFQYRNKVDDGRLMIKAGELPTLATQAQLLGHQGRTSCAS